MPSIFPCVKDNKVHDDTRGLYNRDGEVTIYPVGMLVARGYALVTACYCDVSPDPDAKDVKNGVKLHDTFAYTGIFDLL